MGHDTEFHLANISSITNKLSIGKLLVQEPLEHIANDFGYGTRFFYPPVPHLTAAYIAKILSAININNIAVAMRITQFLTFFLSGITFFRFSKENIQKRKNIIVIIAFLYSITISYKSNFYKRSIFRNVYYSSYSSYNIGAFISRRG